MLDHPAADIDLGHLPAFSADHRRQRPATGRAHAPRVRDRLVRDGLLTQRPPVMPGLSTGLPAAAFPSRHRRRLAQALRARRPVRVPRIRLQPASQLRVLRAQRLDLGAQFRYQSRQLGNLGHPDLPDREEVTAGQHPRLPTPQQQSSRRAARRSKSN